MQCARLVLIGEDRLIHTLKILALSDCPRSLLRQIVDAEHHILRRNSHRSAVRGFQQIVGGQEQETAFRLRLHRQRKMYRHLVTVKIGVERRTYQRVELDRLTLDQDRLKSLDSKPVKCRCTVQHDRMLLDDLLEHIPDSLIEFLDKLLGMFDVLRDLP